MLLRLVASFKLAFLFSFQLLIESAIKIPITTRIISPIAYFKYFPVFPSESKFCLIFLKNFIISYWLVMLKYNLLYLVQYTLFIEKILINQVFEHTYQDYAHI